MNINEFSPAGTVPPEGELLIAMLPLLECPETKHVMGLTACAVYYGDGSSYNVNGEVHPIAKGYYYADAIPYRGEDGVTRLSNALMPLRFEPTIWKQLNIIKSEIKPIGKSIQFN